MCVWGRTAPPGLKGNPQEGTRSPLQMEPHWARAGGWPGAPGPSNPAQPGLTGWGRIVNSFRPNGGTFSDVLTKSQMHIPFDPTTSYRYPTMCEVTQAGDSLLYCICQRLETT